MSLLYTDVEKSELTKKAALYGAKEFVYVKVKPEITNQFPFPFGHEFPAYFMTKKYETMGENILNFKIRPDDIWISTFPKSGTTWTLNIMQQLINNIDLSTSFINERHLHFEAGFLQDINSENCNDEDYITFVQRTQKRIGAIDKEPSPRLIKSHLPAQLLPKEIWTTRAKLIYVCRDAKDVAISMYHMFRNVKRLRYLGTMEEFFDLFLNDHIVYGPFYEHANSFKQLIELDHVLLLNYEDMSVNPFAAVKKISEFLNYSYSDDQLKQLTEHVSFENMRKHFNEDPKIFSPGYKFFRKGLAGGYRDEMSDEYIRKFDEWKQNNTN